MKEVVAAWSMLSVHFIVHLMMYSHRMQMVVFDYFLLKLPLPDEDYRD